MKPTNEELARLIPEAAAEATNSDGQLTGGEAARRAITLLEDVVVGWSKKDCTWTHLRALALHALYLCALIAWEAGRRAARSLTGFDNIPASTQEAVAALDQLQSASAWGSSPRMFVNDGRGGLRPLDGPADEPAAKSVDVDALLRDADALHPGRAEAGLVRGLAAALRAERERHADTARCLGESEAQCRQEHERAERLREAGEHVEGLWQSANGHLRAVLAHGWPDGTTAPEVVRKARAHLAGEEQAPAAKDWKALFEREGRASAEAGRRCVEAWDKLHAVGHELIAKERECANLRAQLATEDEAHAHTRARLAEVERERDAGREYATELRGLWKEEQGKVDALREKLQVALAAQNRAEAGAATLRIEVTDLRRTVSEGETLVESLIAWAKKGRA